MNDTKQESISAVQVMILLLAAIADIVLIINVIHHW
jgi:hypothetical protein